MAFHGPVKPIMASGHPAARHNGRNAVHASVWSSPLSGDILKNVGKAMRKALSILSFLLCIAAAFPASQIRQKAEELYASNKPAEARPLLEEAINEDSTDPTLYLYLGITNYQLSDNEKAIAVFKRGLSIAKDNKAVFFYNIGNCYFQEGQFTFAEEMYTSAIAANSSYALAFRNRANSRMDLENYDGAASDYTIYLQIDPQAPERPEIEAILAALRKMQDAIAQKKKDEEARQKALMNEVLNSLNNASEDTKNLSVESLQFKKETEDVDIKD
jgi:tetratricopeptide (TPR) repeat protein